MVEKYVVKIQTETPKLYDYPMRRKVISERGFRKRLSNKKKVISKQKT